MVFSFTDIGGWILIFVRIVAMVGFNPVFSRRNVSTLVRMGLILLLTIVMGPTIPKIEITLQLDFEFVILLLTQLFIGFCLGFVFQIFYYMLFFVGDFLDIQFGLSAAKIFDPGSNIQMSITGNFLNILFMLYFLITNGHLTLIKIFNDSFIFIPIGADINLSLTTEFVLNLFIAVFMLGIKLILPFVIVEFVIEISMGILMRIIPQIHVFVINIQLKLIVGILLLLVLGGPVGSFIDRYLILIFDNMQRILLQ